jgi:hypothetical protein
LKIFTAYDFHPGQKLSAWPCWYWTGTGQCQSTSIRPTDGFAFSARGRLGSAPVVSFIGNWFAEGWLSMISGFSPHILMDACYLLDHDQGSLALIMALAFGITGAWLHVQFPLDDAESQETMLFAGISI